MAQLSVLLDRVHDEYPSVPELMALRALSDSTKEFCSRTHVWQEDLSSITLQPGTGTYDVDVDTGLQLAAIKEVRLDGRRINPIATEVPRRRAVQPGTGAVVGFVQITPASIRVVDTPAETAVITVTAALTLALSNTTADVPAAILDEYGEAIAAGAKMRIVRLAGYPWSNPAAAVTYAAPYYSAINTAKVRAMSALGEADMQVQMRSM